MKMLKYHFKKRLQMTTITVENYKKEHLRGTKTPQQNFFTKNYFLVIQMSLFESDTLDLLHQTNSSSLLVVDTMDNLVFLEGLKGLVFFPNKVKTLIPQ